MVSKEWWKAWIEDLKEIIELNTELEQLISSSPRPVTCAIKLTDITDKLISLLRRSRERELQLAEELELTKEKLAEAREEKEALALSYRSYASYPDRFKNQKP